MTVLDDEKSGVLSAEADVPVETGELAGESVAFVGRLLGMTHDEAAGFVAAAGGAVTEPQHATTTLIVIGDHQGDLAAAIERLKHRSEIAEAVDAGRAAWIRESELWQRLGLVEELAQRRLYTPVMLAELLDVPAAAVRHWHRRGIVAATRCVRRLPYFDFAAVAVARRLAELHHAGCSLYVVDRQLAALGPQTLADAALDETELVVADRRLLMRRGDELLELTGQRRLEFADAGDDPGDQPADDVVSIPLEQRLHTAADAEDLESLADQWELDALEHQRHGRFREAAEAYRSVLLAAGPTAERQFALADVLYQGGELAAARERYYAALELDEEYVEARAALGCVLAELGELELAAATFAGVLDLQPDFADGHFHLATTLQRLSRPEEAQQHFRAFLAIAPDSRWADVARARLEEAPSATDTPLEPHECDEEKE
ncbi:MAG: tetratricopeptide repeat protein [Planctomycetales bacterium]|nr:tetratricopeptide repeat protein [Planctomycetales bacterium]